MTELTKQQIEDMRTSLGLGAQPFTKEAIDSLCALAVLGLAVPEALRSEWIPCSERVPEITGDYLTWFEDQGRATAIGYNKGWMWGDGSRMRDSSHVTHWMPMPAAPSTPSPLARKCRHGYREENCGLCHPELEPKETPQSGA